MVARRNTRADGRLGDAAAASAQLSLALGDADTVVAARIDGAEAQLFRCPTVAGCDAHGQVVAAAVGTSGFVDGLDRTRAWVLDGRHLRTEDVAAGFVLSVVAAVSELYGLPRDTTVTVLHPAHLSPDAVEALRDGLDHGGFAGSLRAATSVDPEIAARSELTPQPRLDRPARRRRRTPAPTRAAVLAAAGALVVLVGGATAATHLDNARDVEPATSRDVVPPVGSATSGDATAGDAAPDDQATDASSTPDPAAPESAPAPDAPDSAAVEPSPASATAVPGFAPAPGLTSVPVPPDGQWPPFSVPDLPDLPGLPTLPEFPLPATTVPAPTGTAAPTTTPSPSSTTGAVTPTP